MGYPVKGNATVKMEIQPEGQTKDFPVLKQNIPLVSELYNTALITLFFLTSY